MLALTLTGLAAISGCTGAPVSNESPTQALPTGNTGSLAISTDDLHAIRDAVEEFNATAGGPVSEQQTALARLVSPALVGGLQHCSPATTTLRLEPIYGALRAAPDWTAPDGPLTGTTYALPSLIRIYTGERITGTDLSTLHISVDSTRAYLAPMCVG